MIETDFLIVMTSEAGAVVGAQHARGSASAVADHCDELLQTHANANRVEAWQWLGSVAETCAVPPTVKALLPWVA